jgi:signal transduction histidine kinase
LKAYEWESLLKSFTIFFLLLEVLLAINFWHEFHDKTLQLQEKIETELKLCAFTLECDGLITDFVEKDKDKEPNILYKDGDFYSYFRVPTVEKYLMKVTYPRQGYLERVEALKYSLYRTFAFYSIFAGLVSLLFSFYALMPLRRALRLNEEFVKDILHDFNTPISSMRINFKLFKREIGDNPKIERLENNIETILSLQNNMEIFLKGIPTQSETFDLKALLEERVGYFRTLYPDVTYEVSVPRTMLTTNRDALTRILDNLLSNAGKYNKKEGSVSVTISGGTLAIRDTGKGIAHPSRVFDRYYKEQERGIGIGLHIVKKLCSTLGIVPKIESRRGKGTTFFLKLDPLIAKEALEA